MKRLLRGYRNRDYYELKVKHQNAGGKALRSLESHTLNQVETELPVALLARAGAIAAGGAHVIEYANQAPEQSGAFSLQPLDEILALEPLKDDYVYSILGNQLPDIAGQIEKKNRLAKLPIALGALATKSEICTTTGCWSVVDAWRNDKGYAYIFDPAEFNYRTEDPLEFNGVQVHRMAANMKRRLSGRQDLKQREQVDHVCRWGGCCNNDHFQILDHKQNCELRDKAKDLELMIAAGQIILGPVNIEWLDELLISCEEEDTHIIITTPHGPFRLIKINDDPLLFTSKPEISRLQEIVKPPASRKYERPSRGKGSKIDKGYEGLFPHTDFKATRTTGYKRYKYWQKTGTY